MIAELIVHDGRLKGVVFCNTPVYHGLFYNLVKQKVLIDGRKEYLERTPPVG